MPSAPSTMPRSNSILANEGTTMRFVYCLFPALLAGCQSLSGLTGATGAFACKAPDGVACSSVSGVYANLPAAGMASRPGQRPKEIVTPRPTGSPLAMPVAGEALRSDPRVLRIWLAPWIDDDGTLHDQSFLYAQVDAGHWRIGELRRQLAAPAPRPPAQIQQAKAAAGGSPTPHNASKTLANVRADAQAQAAARAAVQSAQPPGERP